VAERVDIKTVWRVQEAPGFQIKTERALKCFPSLALRLGLRKGASSWLLEHDGVTPPSCFSLATSASPFKLAGTKSG